MEFDFSKSTQVDDIEKVPADFRGLYTPKEDGEGFALGSDHEGVKSAVAAISRMQTALKAARNEAKSNKVDLSALKEFGNDPETIYQTFTQRLEESKTTVDPKNEEELQRKINKIKEELSKSHTAEIETRDTQLKTLSEQLHSKIVTTEAVSAMSSNGVSDTELLMPFIERDVRVVDREGSRVAVVVDENGDVRYSGVTGGAMTIEELVKEKKADPKFAIFFKSEARQGSDRPPGNNRVAPKQRAEMSSTDKISAGLAKKQALGN